MIEKRNILRYVPIKVISFIGTGISDYADFIIVENREKVLRLFFEYLLKKNSLWDKIELAEIRENSPNMEIIRELLLKYNKTAKIFTSCRCPYVLVSKDWKGYYSSLSAKFRNDLRTQHNKLLKSEFSFSFCTEKEKLNEQLLSVLMEMHFTGIIAKNKKSKLQTKDGLEFVKSLLNKLEIQKMASLYIMRINNEIAAYGLGFRYGRKYYFWNMGKNNKYARLNPGKLLICRMIRDMFENINIDEFDFLRGEEDYKYRWTKLQRTNYQVNVINKSWYSRIVFKMDDLYHARIKHDVQQTRA
ncbi:MAG: GNAT family N-acetyltransferase [Candidatus Scalindua sp.]